MDELENAKVSVQELDKNYNHFSSTFGIQLLETQCPEQDFSQIDHLLESSRANLDVISGATMLAMKLTECERINQIYTILSHDVLCTDTVSAIAWTFSSLLVISVCGLLIITFRTVLISVKMDNNNLSVHDNDSKQSKYNQDDEVLDISDEEMSYLYPSNKEFQNGGKYKERGKEKKMHTNCTVDESYDGSYDRSEDYHD